MKIRNSIVFATLSTGLILNKGDVMDSNTMEILSALNMRKLVNNLKQREQINDVCIYFDVGNDTYLKDLFRYAYMLGQLHGQQNERGKQFIELFES